MPPTGSWLLACLTVLFLTQPAAAQARVVVLQCPAPSPAGLCPALTQSLQATVSDDLVVTESPETNPEFGLVFVPLQSSEHVLKGHLRWQAADGRTGQGPDLELTVMDAVIAPPMLREFARELVRLSDLPL